MESLDATFSEEWKGFCESGDEQQYKEYLREIEFPYRNVLNSSFLIAFCSLTEHVIAAITKENVPDSKNKEKGEKGKGNWLDKNIDLLKTNFDIELNDTDVKLFSHYIRIRNCVAHNGGRISGSKFLNQLKDAIEAVEKYAKNGNFNMITTKDDYLMIGEDLISNVVIKSEEIVERILEKI
ncbi:MAG: hypothetical protein FVQ82_02035 [Planctomycetes bacterium]|nr:hypothetical protein [Planctomycetota bacterium]